jgi:hypothetical protein
MRKLPDRRRDLKYPLSYKDINTSFSGATNNKLTYIGPNSAPKNSSKNTCTLPTQAMVEGEVSFRRVSE